jgi:two-component system NarL family sensor kinase
VILPRLSPATEITLFRIVQEALTNIVKHAGATEVALTLESRAGAVVLTIADNGCGFDTEVRSHIGSLGIVGMRERAESIGAWLRVESTGHGTRVIVEAPGAAPAAPLPPETEPG